MIDFSLLDSATFGAVIYLLTEIKTLRKEVTDYQKEVEHRITTLESKVR